MAREYEHQFIPPEAVPRARLPLLQHLLDTYASETSKTAGVWITRMVERFKAGDESDVLPWEDVAAEFGLR